MSAYQREELTKETERELERGVGKPEGWGGVLVRDERSLRREKSLLSSHTKKAHKIVLVTVMKTLT